MLGANLALVGLAACPRRSVAALGDVPAAIADLTAAAQSDSEVLLQWTPAENATNHRYRIGAGPWLDCDDNSGEQLVDGLSGGTVYSFRVRGVNAGVAGPPSNAASATTEQGEEPPPLPGAIADLTATALSDTEIELDWAPAEGATSHQFRVNGGSAQTASGPPHGVTGLSPETEYDFQVRGVNDVGAGEWSNTATEVTEATAPAGKLLIAIMAGQSNAQGRATRDDETDVDVAGIWQYVTYEADAAYHTIISDITPIKGPDDFHAAEPDNLTVGEYTMRQVLEDGYYDNVVAVPCAVGANGLALEDAPWAPGDPGGIRFEGMIAHVNAAIAAAASQFPGAEIDVALFWVGGEADGEYAVAQATYESVFADFVATARSRITGASAMPVVIGSMVPDKWTGGPTTNAAYEAINRAHVNASLDLTGVYYSRGSDLDDLPDNDNLHYQPAAVLRIQARRLGGVLETVRAGASGPAMTSSATLAVEEDAPFTLALTAEGSHKTFHIVGGADAAAFEITDPYTDPVLRGAADAGLTAGEYVVQVAARDGNGHFGAAQTITVTSAAPSVPATISDLTATAQSATQVLLQFTPAPTATSHEYRIDGGSPVTCADNSGEQLVTGLIGGTEYDFQVRGVNDEGPGEWSNVATETTDAAPPAAAWSTTIGANRNQYATVDGLSVFQELDIGAACGVRADRAPASDTFSVEFILDGFSALGGIMLGVTDGSQSFASPNYPQPGIGGAKGAHLFITIGDTAPQFGRNNVTNTFALPASDTASVNGKVRMVVVQSSNMVSFYWTPAGGEEALLCSDELTTNIPADAYYPYAGVFRAGDSLTANFSGY